jgi:hypothetical protein
MPIIEAEKKNGSEYSIFPSYLRHIIYVLYVPEISEVLENISLLSSYIFIAVSSTAPT